MRVLIDASGVTKRKAGVGIYAKNLIDSLLLHSDLQLFLIAQDDDPELDHSDHPQVTMIRVSSFLMRKPAVRLLFEQTVLPFLLWKHRIDVVHSLHYSFPLISLQAKTVVTIHDMTSFSMPELHVPMKGRLYRFFIRAGARLADGLIFVSHSAERDLMKRFGPPRGMAKTIHHGKTELRGPCPEQALIEVRKKYALPQRFILYVGMIEPRKNLVRLVEAFSTIAERYPETDLVLAGSKGWMYDDLFEQVKKLNLESRIIFPGFIAEEDKNCIMSAAEVFAYVSLYEGFGLPVLEALACGVPTLTSNTSSLPEVVGDAAWMVDPYDVEKIAGALERLLSDPILRDRLRSASVVQAARFTWTGTAEATLAFYRQVSGLGQAGNL